MDELDRVAHRRPAAIHRADLHDLVVARRRLDHLAAFPHGVRRGLLDVDVLAGLQRPDGGERVPVVGRGDDDGVDVLVVEHAPQILDEARLEGGDVLQARVVDPLRRQVRVDVAERLDLDVLEPREAALQRVALAADADAGGDDAIVGAEDAAADVRRRLQARARPKSSPPAAMPAAAAPTRVANSRREMPSGSCRVSATGRSLSSSATISRIVTPASDSRRREAWA